MEGKYGAEDRWSEIATDEFGVAGIEKADENERAAKNDQGDPTIGAFLSPDVEDNDFRDADEEKGEAGEAEAAFADDQSEKESGDGFHAPADGDTTLRDFGEDEQGDESEGNEKEELFGALKSGGEGATVCGPVGRFRGDGSETSANEEGKGLTGKN